MLTDWRSCGTQEITIVLSHVSDYTWGLFYSLIIEDILKILKMETAGPSETSVHIYQTTQHHIP
jgi:hypothetical protein